MIGALGRKSRFLAAGRSSPLENYRASIAGPGNRNENPAALGHTSYRENWWNIESVTGEFLALDNRPDLKLKIEARLQQLLDRSVHLEWSQEGLRVALTPMSGGDSYPANYEASGILQLIALLAAVHNDEIGALFIDEPEISLHPQHQAFLLEEMQRVAGDPSKAGRKLIVCATHSASLLALQSVKDIPNLVFFNKISDSPVQIDEGENILRSTKLAATVARLSITHRMAFFAERVLLVEGPSDEIIGSQLSRKIGLRLLARNAQILPVIGKGEFREVAKLFTLMNKRVGVLADLDALADDNDLVNFFSNVQGALEVANKRGYPSIARVDSELRSSLVEFMKKHGNAVTTAVDQYPYWSDDRNSEKARLRLTLACLLTNPKVFGTKAEQEALALSQRYNALLETLAEVGCFILRKGAIENYYPLGQSGNSKPEIAASIAGAFEEAATPELEERYADVLSAVRFIAPNQIVDEDILLRPKLSAVLGAVFQSMTCDTLDPALNSIARATIGSDASIFELENRSSKDRKAVRVSIRSPLFARKTFPFEIGIDENINGAVPRVLPGKPD